MAEEKNNRQINEETTDSQQEVRAREELERIMSLAYQSKGWLKFVGIMSIIGGVVSIFSIWGILTCWIPIWMGALLFSAGNMIEEAYRRNEPYFIGEFIKKLKTFFVIKGVLYLIGIGFIVLVIVAIIGFILMIGGLGAAGECLQQLPT